MHQLEVFYKKNTDFTYSVVKKSALESNMFTQKRITFEGMMKAQGDKKFRNKIIDDHGIGEMFNKVQKEKSESEQKQKEINIFALLQENDMKNARKNDLGEPTGRREVELLNKWLDGMLNTHVFSQGDLRKDPVKRKEALYKAKLILSISLRDLIRQVSVLCLERGVLIEKVLNNYINIFETETRGNMYDLNELQAKHLKDILRIKSEAVKNTHQESRSKEIETNLREKMQQMEDGAEMYKLEIKKLKDIIKTKEREFDNKFLDLTRRQTIANKQRDKMMRRPPEMMESSESETSSSQQEKKMKSSKKQKNIRDNLRSKKKVGRNDMLNLPSSEDEKVVKKLKNLHEPSSFEDDNESDDKVDLSNAQKKKVKYKQVKKRFMKKKRFHKRGRTNSFDITYQDHFIDDSEDSSSLKLTKRQSKVKKNKEDTFDDNNEEKEKFSEHPEETKRKLDDAEYKDLEQRYKQDEHDLNYVLNNPEQILEEVHKAEDTNNEMNESIEKIEEEQDMVFKEKVAKIVKETFKEFK